MRNWIWGLAAAGALATAAPASAMDDVFVENFDTLAPGTTGFVVDAFGDGIFLIHISGGEVIVATPSDPAKSGTQVYRGTAIEFHVEDPYNISWPAVGAFFTNSADVAVTLWGYDYGASQEVEIFWGMIPAGGTNAYFSADNPAIFTRGLFVSQVPFSIDDFTFGLEGVLPGIPEPASWALMIAGMALAGAGLRRRRPVAFRVSAAM